MKDKSKGLLSLLGIVLVIAAISIIAVLGIGPKKAGSISDVKLGLDLAGGVSITYETVKENPSKEEMADTIYKMQMRAQDFSTESAVYQEGDNRINVDIPDVTDANAVLKKLGDAGTIYFIYGQSEKGEQNILYNAATGDFELKRSMEDIIADGDVVLDGSDIAGAEPKITEEQGLTQYVVQLNLNENGKTKFAKATKYASAYYTLSGIEYHNLVAIVYDGKVVSAPRVEQTIDGGVATISGQASYEEASQLSSTIRIGALPLELTQLRSNVVGAKLGAEAINTSLLAGLIGFIIVFIFMIVYYRIPGLAASIALTMYIGLIIFMLNLFGVTLTLPGIAGIILSIGMAVDANVIIFTRISEELGSGKTVRSAIKIGFSKALSAIIDGNVTTLIAAAVLYLRGSGTIKGFAQTLAIGIIVSLFTALFITKFILTAFYNIGLDREKLYGIKKPVKVRDYVGKGKIFAVISGLLILVCFISLGINKASTGDTLKYGLDFKGGNSTQVTFPNDITDEFSTEVKNLVYDTTGLLAETSRIAGENTLIIKTAVLSLDQKNLLESKLVSDYGVDPQLITSESISGTVSDEMKSDALWAVILATVCMLLYIWIRFKNIGFASSAVIALVHDVIIVLMAYSLLKISVGNTFIACMLTIVGYSINATIITFDRIRENMKEKQKKDTVKFVVNESISQTLSRSINTNLTTFVMVLVLAIIGVDSIREFAIPLIAGLLCGTYTSICVTGNLWYFYQKKFGLKQE